MGSKGGVIAADGQTIRIMNRSFPSLANPHFDLLVCGGGIYGAWTAYDAALRGLRVAIVEQGDWAGATSSASSKLIHGGLRYLETYDFKLVRKALAERQRLLANAPHRVWPLRFGVPVYADSRNGLLKLKAGLTLYDMLANFPGPVMAHRRFDREAFAERFAFLSGDKLTGGFTYGDAQTDDARLVLELVAGAMEAGAVCVNYCRLTGLLETNGQVCGATLRDMLSGNSVQVSAKQIVNTTGQWTCDAEQGREWCRLSKGIHLVLPRLATHGTQADEALLLTAKSDGRVFFIIPWYGMTLLGTTDTDYRGALDHVEVEPADVAYLLAEANHCLKTAWTERDVVGSFAGLRVMKRSDAASPSAVSRDWELKTAANGAHYSIGGKITSAREDAACIVDTVCAQLNIATPCATKSRRFPWAPEADYATWSAEVGARAAQFGIDSESATWLMRRHGKQVDAVLCCSRDEMVVHLDDLLRRRMPLLILAKLADSTLHRCAAIAATALNWDEATLEREIAACRQR
ncbi:MAG TPA: glycerol-3-phosphate dehydrogenase/oxidase [Gallionella sp.]|nr:glycerol-3-phosphate dehydrogenase/oxidase [Gallionella sp.]